MKFAMKPSGWRYESYRHSLAAKGIRTGNRMYGARKYLAPQTTFGDEEQVPFKRVSGSQMGDIQTILGKSFNEDIRKANEEMRRKQYENILKRNALFGGFGLGDDEDLEDKRAFLDVQQRTATPAAKELLAAREVRTIAFEEAFRRRKLAKILDSIDAGEFDRVTFEEEDGTTRDVPFDQALRELPVNEYRAALSKLRKRVTDLAKAGVVTKIGDVPANIREYVETDPTTVSLIRQYEEDRDDAQRSSFLGRSARTAGALAVNAVAGVEVLGRLGARGVQSGIGELEGRPGFFGQPSPRLPGIPGAPAENVFLEGYAPGKFSVAGSFPSKQEIDNLTLGGGTLGWMFGEKALSKDDYVRKEVDELYGARKNLSKVDLSAYEKGMKAFKEGDREGLLRSINELEAQEQTLSDRWLLAEQSRAQIMKPESRAAVYAKDAGEMSPFSVILGGSGGGDVLAERTKKVGEVKRLLKDSRDELFSRRKLLQYGLKRMDSVVPPKSDVPKKVDVLKNEGKKKWLHIPEQLSPKDTMKSIFSANMRREEVPTSEEV